ncbi:MAG: hypothetical protein R6U96_10455 [Promethearchaeia archaeon]
MKKIKEESLTEEIKKLAITHGANLVGICSAESLQDKFNRKRFKYRKSKKQCKRK